MQSASIHFPPGLNYHIAENAFIDQFKDKQSDSPICMVGDINYIDDSPKFDRYVDNDDFLQKEANFADHSTLGFWEEAQFHQLEKGKQPMHRSYDSDEESLENLEEN